MIDGQPVSDRYLLGLAWEINRMKTPHGRLLMAPRER
jgi:hypothetical protein